MMKASGTAPTETPSEEQRRTPARAATPIYSTQTPGPNVAAADVPPVYLRIAALLRDQAETILSAWIAALRGSAPFYVSVPEEALMASLRPIFDAYCRYFADGDPAPFLALVTEGVHARFLQGMPLVEMERNVGAVRIAALPFLQPALAGDPGHLVEAVDAIVTIEEMSFVAIAEAYQAVSTAALVTAQEAVLQAERDKVAFCREIARLATRDKLILCDHEDIPAPPEADRIVIATPRDVRDARHTAARYAASWSDDRSYSLQLCIGEAGSNALRHAGGATFEIWSSGDEVSCRFADSGPGIDFCRIPEALRSGFSTGSTLGMGFTLMMDTADRVHLATDHQGTTLQITFSP